MAERYLFSYQASGFSPVWTRSFEFESEDYAVQAARDLMRVEAAATAVRPLTLLVGVGEDEDQARWIGCWSWDPDERWRV